MIGRGEMTRRHAVVLIGGSWGMGIAISDGAAEMQKIHVPTPEAEVLLRLAAEELAEYRAKQRVFGYDLR
jgi:hypothetical protein